MNIYDFGWSDKTTNKNVNLKNIARITAVHKSVCQAISSEGEINIYLSGRILNDDSLILVTGDFIEMSPRFIDEQNKQAAIVENILPRWSKLSRIAPEGGSKEQVLVSNLNYAFIVTAADDDFNINRLQRYSLLAEQGGVTPVLILSKIDLVENSDRLRQQIEARLGHLELLLVSSAKRVGLTDLREKLQPGVTAAFIGSSGVGKSTLVNHLMNETIQKTVEVRQDDSKGRHTTTARELFFLPNGGMIIDTPGLREVQIFANEESITNTFPVISELIENCKFSNCTHTNEPGCAINHALKNETLSHADYDNFLKMQKEARYNERKMNKTTSSNDKRRWKKINQNMRARRKFEGKD